MQTLEGVTYLDNREVAERLGLHPGTIRNRRSDGTDPIPCVRFGRSVLYRACDVEDYLKRGR